MVVEVATGTIGTRAVSQNYPNTEGLILGTTKRSNESASLIPQEANLTPQDLR